MEQRMAVGLQQCIAGVEYRVYVPSGISPPSPHALQMAFASPFPRWAREPAPPAGDSICVDLVVGEMPDLRSWRMLLSSGPLWSLWQRDGQRCLRLGSPTPRLVACWPADACRATVHCGPDYLTVRPEGVELHYSAGYPVDQLLLIYYLAGRQGLLVHAAGLMIEGRALLFPGVSGAGKSTLARHFLARGWASLLSDDRIFVRRTNGAHLAFGTPWPGDAGVALNAGAPLVAILFPARGMQTRISELSPQAALERLLPAASILWHEPELLTHQLESCEHLLRDVPAFELAWSPSNGVVDDLHAFLRRL
jgi:hypothetical protein